MRLILQGRELELPELSPSQGGGFAFALHKGGSVFLNSALARLTRHSTVGYFSLPTFLVEKGLSINSITIDQEQQRSLRRYFSCPGTVYGGWRMYPKEVDLPISRGTKTFLLVRDPRDILTSYYFHMKSSARELGPNADKVKSFRASDIVDIDSFVLSEASEFLSRYMSYDNLAASSDMLLRRYEDVIFDKTTLLKELCQQFGIDVGPNKIARAAIALDRIPEKENEASHVRQVVPGDHKRKLSGETIERLNMTFAPILRRYGYA